MLRRSGIVIRSPLAWLLLLVVFHADPALSEEFALLPGAQIEKQLEPGAAHYYRIGGLDSDVCLVEVEQRGIDVVITVRSPDGEEVLSVDSPFDRQGTETALFRADAPGHFLVDIRSREETGAAGRYAIRRTSLKEPRRLEAAAAATEGDCLYNLDFVHAAMRATQSERRTCEGDFDTDIDPSHH